MDAQKDGKGSFHPLELTVYGTAEFRYVWSASWVLRVTTGMLFIHIRATSNTNGAEGPSLP